MKDPIATPLVINRHTVVITGSTIVVKLLTQLSRDRIAQDNGTPWVNVKNYCSPIDK